MRVRRRVTLQPTIMPARSLNVAMDFLALVITGRCPVIRANSSAALSIFLRSWDASPTPMLTTIFSSFGTRMGFW